MSKIAEQKALEAYPDVTLEECHGDIKMMKYCNSDNPSLREGYSTGYDQAMQDFMKKACEWLEDTQIENFICRDDGIYFENEKFVEQFKNYMQDEM